MEVWEEGVWRCGKKGYRCVGRRGMEVWEDGVWRCGRRGMEVWEEGVWKCGKKGVWRCGKMADCIYLSLHCRHQNDSCIKVDNDERQFNVSLIVMDKVTRQCPQNTIFEEKGELKRIRTDVPLSTRLKPYPKAKLAHKLRRGWLSVALRPQKP